MSAHPRFSMLFVILLSISLEFTPDTSAAQRKESAEIVVEWRNMTAQITDVLSESGVQCPDELISGPSPVQTGDITGDGVPEALVEYCHMGAYTSDFVLMSLERGTPVLAHFRNKNKETIPVEFLRGASVRNGENTTLLPQQHAVYAIHWHTDDSGILETCTVDAFVWNPKGKTFDQSSRISKGIERSECPRVRKQLECTEHQ
jgi:hypothetical protein